jgi:hypothetical protein
MEGTTVEDVKNGGSGIFNKPEKGNIHSTVSFQI